jgi:hypothetical protein
MKKNPFHTHRKYLINELNKLDRQDAVTCLELGVGHGSSPIFKRFVKKSWNMKVIAYESDEKWLEVVRSQYATNDYILNFIPSWDGFYQPERYPGPYDLVFVDQSPWEARIQSMERLMDKTKVFILHDYDYYNKGVIDDIYSVGEGSFFYEKFNDDFILEAKTEFLPPTLILRNRKYAK